VAERRPNAVSKAIRRARDLARLSALPLPKTEHAIVVAMTFAFRGARSLVRRLLTDRVPQRASGLAFHTLLAIVPMAAVTIAIMRAFLGAEGLRSAIFRLATHYLPDVTSSGVDQLLPLVEGLDLSSVGILGTITLLPVMVGLVSEVELSLADIFRTPRRARILRLPIYALLVTVGPMFALFSVRYTAGLSTEPFLDRHVAPVIIVALLLFLAFRLLPFSQVRSRAALTGAIVAAVLLEVGKVAFSIWATHLTRGVHVVWGAVAFVPLLLVWVFLSWFVVLLGAELAAVVHDLVESLVATRLVRGGGRRRPRGYQRRLRRTLLRRAAKQARTS